MNTPKKFVLNKQTFQNIPLRAAPEHFEMFSDLKAQAPYVYKSPIGVEVDALVREWYAKLGQTISPDELRMCREIDSAEINEAEKIEAAAAATKPVYGTPEFWKIYWAKKKGVGTASSSKAAKGKQTPVALKCAK